MSLGILFDDQTVDCDLSSAITVKYLQFFHNFLFYFRGVMEREKYKSNLRKVSQVTKWMFVECLFK